MRTLIASTFALGALLLGADPAAAQDMPRWALADICAKASAPAHCSRLEGEARNVVSGGWAVLPVTVRTACLTTLKAPADQSWRLLSECLEIETIKGLDRRAIATSATPAPPLAPALTKDGLPQPLFGVPTEAPKIQ